MVGKNKGKIHTNTEFGTVLGLSGIGLGGSWNSSGRFWPPLGRFLDVPSRAFFKHGPKMGSKRPPGSMLGRSKEGFGRILEGFGKVFGRIRAYKQ